MNKELPEILRKIRVLRNLSQEYVAEQIGVSLSSYARYEKGTVVIDFDSVIRLAELYKMSIDEIVHYGDPNFRVEEPKASYVKKSKILVTVELDGVDETLQNCIKKLTAINGAL